MSPEQPFGERTSSAKPLFQELRELLGGVDGDELLGLIQLFHSAAGERAQEARAAYLSGDLETLRRAGHTLRSMGAGVGAWDLAGMAARLEDWARTRIASERGPGDEALVDELLGAIDAELMRIARAAAAGPTGPTATTATAS